MGLEYKIFTLPVNDSSDVAEELNKFLKTVRGVNTRWEFVGQGDASFWTALVSYQAGKSPQQTGGKRRVDYRDVLSPKDFALFAKLRDWRNATAEKENLPAYTVFTNEQLAGMAEKRLKSVNDLRNIDGVGDIRIEKYGEAVLKIIAENGKTDAPKTEAGEQ